jgi:hypothetical protein
MHNTDPASPPVEPFSIRNAGEPIYLTDVNMSAITAESARGGDTVEVIVRIAISSEEALFHKIVPNIASVIEFAAQRSGHPVKLDNANSVLLVIRPDHSAELWVDTEAVVHESVLKRPGPLEAGTVLFENDIADIRGVWFPLVDIGPKDRIIYLFREGWRFGLLFDGNRSESLAIEDAKRDIGYLYRRMKYADLYAALAHAPTFTKLVEAGWFPFLELMTAEFQKLLTVCEAGFDLGEEEKALVLKFDTARLDRMFECWMQRPHLKSREAIFRSAVSAFKAGDPVAVLKTVLTEIDGILSDAYFRTHKEHTRHTRKLLDSVIEVIKANAGKDTLYFPESFAVYLRDYAFAEFQRGQDANKASRHTVGHGALPAEQYTMPRALQALLTLDQLAFYT